MVYFALGKTKTLTISRLIFAIESAVNMEKMKHYKMSTSLFSFSLPKPLPGTTHENRSLFYF